MECLGVRPINDTTIPLSGVTVSSLTLSLAGYQMSCVRGLPLCFEVAAPTMVPILILMFYLVMFK